MPDPIDLLRMAAPAIGAAMALVPAVVALRAHKQVGSPALRRFAAGFVLLAISQLLAATLEAVTADVPSLPTRQLDGYDALFGGYYGALLGGLALVLSTFERRKLRIVLALAPALLIAGPIAQIAALSILFLIVVHAGLNHIERARTGSVLTTLGFFLLFVGHAAFLLDYAPLTPRNLLGEGFVLSALALLALAALRAGGRRRDA